MISLIVSVHRLGVHTLTPGNDWVAAHLWGDAHLVHAVFGVAAHLWGDAHLLHAV